jgi:hypothetical protein
MKRDTYLLTQMLYLSIKTKTIIRTHQVSFDTTKANYIINSIEALDLGSFYVTQFAELYKKLSKKTKKALNETLKFRAYSHITAAIYSDYLEVSKDTLAKAIKQVSSLKTQQIIQETLIKCLER